MGIESVHSGASSGTPTLNYRSGDDDRVVQREVASGCVYQMCATLVTLACLVSFLAFAWLAVALLLLAMYPQGNWSAPERGWIGATSVLTGLAAVICFMGAVRAFPVRLRRARGRG